MRRLVMATLAVLLLSGCFGGSDTSDAGKGDATASAKPTPTGPPCEDIWKVDETLPTDYESCVLAGAAAPQEVYECLDGTQLVAFNDQMYALTGGKILKPDVQPFQDTEEYGKTFVECTGE